MLTHMIILLIHKHPITKPSDIAESRFNAFSQILTELVGRPQVYSNNLLPFRLFFLPWDHRIWNLREPETGRNPISWSNCRGIPHNNSLQTKSPQCTVLSFAQPLKFTSKSFALRKTMGLQQPQINTQTWVKEARDTSDTGSCYWRLRYPRYPQNHLGHWCENHYHYFPHSLTEKSKLILSDRICIPGIKKKHPLLFAPLHQRTNGEDILG